MMVCVDSNSRTLTDTSCFSVVLVHERHLKLRIALGEWLANPVCIHSALSADVGSMCVMRRAGRYPAQMAERPRIAET